MTPKIEDFLNKDGIQVKEEIVNGEKFYIVSYIFNDSELWREPINLEARGITFDQFGDIVCRPFQKFFNINENQFTQFKDLDFTEANYFDKVDGSMITGAVVHGKVYWKTKKSFYSDVAIECQKYFGGVNVYTDCVLICSNWASGAWTPIFEFTSPMNRVVIDYGNEPKLTLLAIRHNETGKYLSHDLVESFAKYHGINIVKKYDIDDITQILIQDSEDREGYVIQLSSGQRVKYKFPTYLTKHRTLDNFNARNLAKLVIDELVDDMKPVLSPYRVKILEALEKNVWMEYNIISSIVHGLVKEWEGLELKDIGRNYSSHPQFHPAIQIFKGKDVDNVLKEYYTKFRIETFSTKQLW